MSGRKMCSFLLIALLLWVTMANAKQTVPDNLWKGLIGEAVSEGYVGMYSVGCVYRNRIKSGMPLGCVALKRRDLSRFVKKQGKRYEQMSKEIVRILFSENGLDITNGATHYENVSSYGMPKWARGMKIVAKLKSHTFFR